MEIHVSARERERETERERDRERDVNKYGHMPEKMGG